MNKVYEDIRVCVCPICRGVTSYPTWTHQPGTGGYFTLKLCTCDHSLSLQERAHKLLAEFQSEIDRIETWLKEQQEQA